MKNRTQLLLILVSALCAFLYAEGSAFAQSSAPTGYYYTEPYGYGTRITGSEQNFQTSGAFSRTAPSSNGFYHSTTPSSCQSSCPQGAAPATYSAPVAPETTYKTSPFHWLSRVSMEMTVGWGYLYYNTLKLDQKKNEGEIKAFLKKSFNYGTNLALTLTNFNGELFFHFPVAKYYTVGLGVQSFFLSSAFVSLDNRLRIPLASGNALFFDFPVGVNVTNFPEKRPIISAGARTGIILMGAGHFGFIMHLGTDGVFIPRKKEEKSKKIEYKALVSARAGLGLFVSF